jgi:hypothetical protein
MTELGHPFSSAESLAAWSQLATLVIALAAALGALQQIRETRRLHREGDAQSSFRDYLRLAYETPEFASPDWPQIKGTIKEEQYHWFVSYMLAAFEKILLTTEGDAEWRRSISTSVKRHSDYVRDRNFKNWQLAGYAEELRKLLFKKTGRLHPEDGHLFGRTKPEMDIVIYS